jgi:hypothetical protein
MAGKGVLVCAECGLEDDGARGWTVRLDYDDEPGAFLPGMREREFTPVPS